MRILVNRDVLAISECLYRQSVVIPIDYQKYGFTPFGLFIPIHSAGTGFLRVLRGEVSPEAFAKCEVTVELVRIDHLGQVSIVIVDTVGNNIHELPITSTKWTTFGFHQAPVKAANAAYDYMVQECKTIEAAIKRIEATSAEGFFQPLILRVENIVKELAEKDLNKEIVFTSLTTLKHYVKI